MLEVTALDRQHQRFLERDGDIPGDCWRTAIACLLEIPRDDVPHFIHEHGGDEESTDWWYATVAFVEAARPGWTLVCLRPYFPIYAHPEDGPARVVLTGGSPRGAWLHCVVADAITGELVHDPFPDGTGVTDHVEVSALIGKVTTDA